MNRVTQRSRHHRRIMGSGEPAMEVYGNSVLIPPLPASSTPYAANHTDFGYTPVGTTITRTFTIQNNGTGPLHIASISVPSGFTLLSSPTLVAAGDSETFQVRATALARNVDTGNVTINSDDPINSSYGFAIRAGIGYLLVSDYSVDVDPAVSPTTGRIGRIELVHPNADSKIFFSGGSGFIRNGSGANLDTGIIGADASGNAFPIVNGTFAIVKLSLTTAKTHFGLSTAKSPLGGNPRFENEYVAGNHFLEGIRTTTGTFNSAGVSATVARPANLWFLWTDQLYFGLNDKIVFAQNIAPSGSRFPYLVRVTNAASSRNYAMILGNDFTNFLTGKAQGYILSAPEYQEITDFLALS